MNFEQFAGTHAAKIKEMKLTLSQRTDLLDLLKIAYDMKNKDCRVIIWEDPNIDAVAAIRQLQDFFDKTTM